MADVLSLWTVYEHPSDYPNCFVARRFEIGNGPGPRATGDVMISPLLEPLRIMLEGKGLTCLARSPDDDPKIVETWI